MRFSAATVLAALLTVSPGNNGNDGEDWKCRNVPGLLKPGVGGIASRTCCGGALVFAGVVMERPRLLGFRFGGDGGLTKDGEAAPCSSGVEAMGKLVVDDALPGCRDVFTAKFLRFRPFFRGAGFCSSKKGAELGSSVVRGRSIPAVKVFGGGDSGEEPGDGSVALESSTVEIVVVGEESLEP